MDALRAKRGFGIGVAAAVAALLLGPAPAAEATNFFGASSGTGCTGNIADNAEHTIAQSDVTSATGLAVSWSRTNNYDPTRINTVFLSTPDSNTDAVIFDEDYEGTLCGATWISTVGGGGLIGLASCLSLSGARCQRFNVYFDTDYMGPRSDAAERALACHELGHTVGLKHAGAGCMMTGAHTTTTLTGHDNDHLNDVNYY